MRKTEEERLEDFTEGLLAGSLKSMGHTYRYATFPMHKPESVAEHSYWAATYALIIWHKLNELYPDWLKTIVRKEVVMEMALTHDLEERISGDIVKNFRDGNKELAKQIDAQAVQGSLLMFQIENMPPSFIQSTLWFQEKHSRDFGDLTLEAEIVALADTMCVASKLLGEAEMGNVLARGLLSELFIPSMIKIGRDWQILENKYLDTGELSHKDLVHKWVLYFYKDMGDVLYERISRNRAGGEQNLYLGVWKDKVSRYGD